MLLALLAIAWMIGIVATDVLPLAGEMLVGSALLGVGTAVAGWQTPRLRVVGLCLLAASLGGLRYLGVQPDTTPQSVWLLAGHGTVMVEGHVAQEPRRTETGQQVVLHTVAARRDGQASAVQGRLLVQVPSYPVYHYGQRLLVRGALEQPPTATRPNAFDYRDYLARKQIYALLHEPEIEVLPGNAGNPLLVAVLNVRNACQELVLRALPEPQASVAAGMLLGLKSSIPDDVYETFGQTGLAHLLVVSGWHLSLVAVLLMGVAARLRLGRGGTFWVALAGIWLYALFVGASATVLRAAIMASLLVLASSTRRQAEPWTLLLAACLGLSLWNPHLLWDLGFQLSVLATASLFAFSQPVQHWLERLPLLRWPGAHFITNVLAATLAVQVLILPLILYHFGNLSLVAPLANVVIVPVVPFAMILGAAALAVNLLLAPLAAVPLVGALAWGAWLVAWLPFAYMTEAARLLAALPWAAIRVPAFPLWLLFAYYAVVGGWWWLRQHTPHSTTAGVAHLSPGTHP
jgi:competence protein ComEC